MDELIAEPAPGGPRPVLQYRGHHPLRPRWRAPRRPTAAGPRRARRVRRGLRAHPGHPVPVQQHRAGHPGDRRRNARRRNRLPRRQIRRRLRPPAAAIELDDSLPYDEPWGWMQPTGTPTAHCCSSRATSRRPPPCTPPTSVWTRRSAGRASTPTTCGACTATTNACNGWAVSDEATIIGQQLALAGARADIPDYASCACRLEVAEPVPLTVMPALRAARSDCRRDRDLDLLPPGPTLMSSRKVTPAPRRRLTSASRSST